ncbi:hypothetical protein EMIT074MI3_11228 [Bacillus licheniformis]|nr:hypothetical protein [Bacillaceae bacterium HSR45]
MGRREGNIAIEINHIKKGVLGGAFFLFLLTAERSDLVQVNTEVNPAELTRPPAVARNRTTADENRVEPKTAAVSQADERVSEQASSDSARINGKYRRAGVLRKLARRRGEQLLLLLSSCSRRRPRRKLLAIRII